MYLSQSSYNQLAQFFKQSEKLENSELEIRFHFDNTISKNPEIFKKVISSFKKLQTHDLTLDVIITENRSDKYRVSLIGKDAINKFSQDMSLSDIMEDTTVNTKAVKKTIVERISIPEYNELSFVLSTEKPVSSELIPKDSKKAFYRYKKRYSKITEHFDYDFTYVKTGNNETHYEYEIEAKAKDVNDIKQMLDSVLSGCYKLLKIVNNRSELLPHFVERDILRDYIMLVTNNKIENPIFVGPQPVGFEHRHMEMLSEDYSVTVKVDGERRLLFINNRGQIFLINQKLNVEIVKDFGPYYELANSLFDVEKVSETKVVAFDAYFIRDQPVYDKDLKTRLEAVNTLKNTVPDFVSNKVFETADKEGIERLLNIYNISSSFDKDGLVFTPFNEPLPLKLGYSKKWDKLLKWKPLSQNSIDFMFEYHDTITRDFVTYKRYKLLCGSKTRKYNSMMEYLKNPNDKVTYELIPFNPVSLKPLPYELTSLLWLEEDKSDINKQIGECIFQEDTWKLLRLRNDKSLPNDMKIANSTWKTTIHPINLQDIKDKKLEYNPDADIDEYEETDHIYYLRGDNESFKGHMMIPLKIFHNKIVKNSLIGAFHNKVKSIFDVACGQGGDLFKYHKTGARDMLGVDLYYHNIMNEDQGALSRLAGSKIPKHYRYLFLTMDSGKPYRTQINTDSNDDDDVLKTIVWGVGDEKKYSSELQKYYKMAKPKSFDLVSCQFALHYFFKNKSTLLSFVDNVDSMLSTGGYFIGTCFDSMKVNDLLSNSSVREGLKNNVIIWKLTKKYKRIFNPSTSIGYKIGVYIATIGKEIDEYMISFDLLVQLLSERNIYLINSEEENRLGLKSRQGFQEMYENMNVNNNSNPVVREVLSMSTAEKELSFLYQYFVFTRRK